jgi:hypothetical protein
VRRTASDAHGPFLPFGHATDFAVAADQSGRPCEAQHFPAMDGMLSAKGRH